MDVIFQRDDQYQRLGEEHASLLFQEYLQSLCTVEPFFATGDKTSCEFDSSAIPFVPGPSRGFNFPLLRTPQDDSFSTGTTKWAAAAQTTSNSPAITLMPWTTSVQTLIQAPQRPQRAVTTAGNVSVARTKPGSADRVATESVHNDTPQQPLDTNTNHGTYTCTYHGCTLRFGTRDQLQMHKERHWRGRVRNNATGVASTLLNTQSGPHRCDQINPSTAKPCNTVFSRPYDLTRHEDAIHDAGKQKNRCKLCTDERTFRRADGLSQHYRVYHPGVGFPQKQHRGRGSSSRAGAAEKQAEFADCEVSTHRHGGHRRMN